MDYYDTPTIYAIFEGLFNLSSNYYLLSSVLFESLKNYCISSKDDGPAKFPIIDNSILL
jgi:hypothetical protein